MSCQRATSAESALAPCKLLVVGILTAASAACQLGRGPGHVSGEPVLVGELAPPAASRPPEGPRLPPRPSQAMTGSAFMASVADLDPAAREEAIYNELAAGNLPDFLRELVPVRMVGPDGPPAAALTLHVMPDYLAVGSNDDFIRVAVNLHTAAKLAQAWGFLLPTPAIVDAIFAQAAVQLWPKPLPASPQMTSTPYLLRHEKLVFEQLKLTRPGRLTAGHKKDVVISDKLNRRPNRLWIYGWHQASGLPIQPLSPAHHARYADYSHGIRLVSTTVWFNGEPRSIYELLATDGTARLLSDEGPLDNLKFLLSPRS